MRTAQSKDLRLALSVLCSLPLPLPVPLFVIQHPERGRMGEESAVSRGCGVPLPSTKNRHFDRSCSRHHREQRSGEIRFSTSTVSQSITRRCLCPSLICHPSAQPEDLSSPLPVVPDHPRKSSATFPPSLAQSRGLRPSALAGHRPLFLRLPHIQKLVIAGRRQGDIRLSRSPAQRRTNVLLRVRKLG